MLGLKHGIIFVFPCTQKKRHFRSQAYVSCFSLVSSDAALRLTLYCRSCRTSVMAFSPRCSFPTCIEQIRAPVSTEHNILQEDQRHLCLLKGFLYLHWLFHIYLLNVIGYFCIFHDLQYTGRIPAQIRR